MVQLDNNKKVEVSNNNLQVRVLNKMDTYDINKEMSNIRKSFKNVINTFESMQAILIIINFFILYNLSSCLFNTWDNLELGILKIIVVELFKLFGSLLISIVFSNESKVLIELLFLNSNYNRSNIKIINYAYGYLKDSLVSLRDSRNFLKDLFENYDNDNKEKSKTVEASNLIVNQLLFRNTINENSLKAVKYLDNNKCKIKSIKLKEDSTAIIKLKNKETIKVTEVFIRDDFKEVLLYVYNSGLILYVPNKMLEDADNKGEQTWE